MDPLLKEARQLGIPVTLTLTNGQKVVGIVDRNVDGVVTLSTKYAHAIKSVTARNTAGYLIDPDVPPTHIRVDHISTFTY